MPKEDIPEETVERPGDAVRPDSVMTREEARAVLDTQVQIMRRMNDELLRTARVHVVLGGAIVTIISVVNASLFLPNSDLLAWFVGFTLSSLSFIAWYNHLGASRLSYTDLSIGVHRSLESFHEMSDDKPDSTVGRLRRAFENVPIALSTFLGNNITPQDFEEEINQDEAVRQMLSDDHPSAVEHNNWILATREKYLNAVQNYLYGAFLLLLLGILLMVVA